MTNNFIKDIGWLNFKDEPPVPEPFGTSVNDVKNWYIVIRQSVFGPYHLEICFFGMLKKDGTPLWVDRDGYAISADFEDTPLYMPVPYISYEDVEKLKAERRLNDSTNNHNHSCHYLARRGTAR